jgi:NADPH-dependent curcumin reductase
MPQNRQWVLAARPVGRVTEECFAWRESAPPVPAAGEALVRTLYLSLDPAMRGWLEDRPSYLPPVQIGEVMRGGAVAQVVESHAPELAPGDLVRGTFGWQDYAIARPGRSLGLQKLPTGVDPELALGVLGLTGLSGYFGMLDIGRPQPGETVVVSGAAGATGSIAAQIARIQGAHVIGIAGGTEKCDWLVHHARLDAAIDYKRGPVDAALRELCPRGIDVYFDNVGGPILEAVLGQLAERARIVLCGGISSYNATEPPPGPRNLMNLVLKRARMEGFLVMDHAARFAEATAQISAWLDAGELAHEVDIQEGLENAPKALLRLFEGRNTGKQLLRVARVQTSV